MNPWPDWFLLILQSQFRFHFFPGGLSWPSWVWDGAQEVSHTLHCPPSVTSLDFHCPIWQPLNTCVYSALEVGLVQLEMCRKCKLCTSDTLDILDKIKYIFRVNFICILLLFSMWLLENSKLQMWLAIYFYWITLVEAASSMRAGSGQSCSLSILYAMCIQWTSWFTHPFHRY